MNPGGVQLLVVNGWIRCFAFTVPRDIDSTTNHAIPGPFYRSAADLEPVDDLRGRSLRLLYLPGVREQGHGFPRHRHLTPSLQYLSK
jgi:hypothetical protein